MGQQNYRFSNADHWIAFDSSQPTAASRQFKLSAAKRTVVLPNAGSTTIVLVTSVGGTKLLKARRLDDGWLLLNGKLEGRAFTVAPLNHQAMVLRFPMGI